MNGRCSPQVQPAIDRRTKLSCFELAIKLLLLFDLTQRVLEIIDGGGFCLVELYASVVASRDRCRSHSWCGGLQLTDVVSHLSRGATICYIYFESFFVVVRPEPFRRLPIRANVLFLLTARIAIVRCLARRPLLSLHASPLRRLSSCEAIFPAAAFQDFSWRLEGICWQLKIEQHAIVAHNLQ